LEFLVEYGLFFAKTVTILFALIVLIIVVVGMNQKTRRSDRGHIEVRSLNENVENITRTLKQMVLNQDAFKQEMKSEKKRHKEEAKAQKKAMKGAGPESGRKDRVYVLDFEGDLQASAVENLREEITAVLSVAEPQDEVLVRVESPGGHVHGYGLAASQLKRVIDSEISLTIAVDKVAASGGYMMACIGKKIIAAPFALLGSIGVVAQLPNFHRFLKNRDVDVEVLTAGEYKRTLTMFGENTDQGREKFLEELQDVHELFKEFVVENRPVVDIDAVATGEAWYGRRALDHKLVDELKTSDEYVYDKCQSCDVFHVRYIEDKNKIEQVMDRFSSAFMKMTGRDQSDLRGPYTF
jgi:serine protease SohB